MLEQYIGGMYVPIHAKRILPKMNLTVKVKKYTKSIKNRTVYHLFEMINNVST